MNLELLSPILIGIQVVVDLALILAIFFLYRRLKLLGPKKLDNLINLLKENEALIQQVISSLNLIKKDSSIKEAFLLLREGKSIKEVAQLTGMSESEVELLWRKNKASHDDA